MRSIPKLQAEERLSALTVAQIASGMLTPEGQREADKIVRDWRRAIDSISAERQRPTRAAREQFAAALGIEIRRTKHSG